MQIDSDTLEIQRAKKAAKIASEVSGGSRRPWNSYCTRKIISATGFVHGVSQSFVHCFDRLEWTLFQIMMFI